MWNLLRAKGQKKGGGLWRGFGSCLVWLLWPKIQKVPAGRSFESRSVWQHYRKVSGIGNQPTWGVVLRPGHTKSTLRASSDGDPLLCLLLSPLLEEKMCTWTHREEEGKTPNYHVRSAPAWQEIRLQTRRGQQSVDVIQQEKPDDLSGTRHRLSFTVDSRSSTAHGFPITTFRLWLIRSWAVSCGRRLEANGAEHTEKTRFQHSRPPLVGLCPELTIFSSLAYLQWKTVLVNAISQEYLDGGTNVHQMWSDFWSSEVKGQGRF